MADGAKKVPERRKPTVKTVERSPARQVRREDSPNRPLPGSQPDPTEELQDLSDPSPSPVAEKSTESQDFDEKKDDESEDAHVDNVTEGGSGQVHGSETPPPVYESPFTPKKHPRTSSSMSRKSAVTWAEPRPPSRRKSVASQASKNEEMEMSETSKWKDLFKEFTQDTTLHGIRFTTMNTNFRSRRMLWIIMMLTALAIFLYYLSDRLVEYFKYAKTVNVEESYVDTMEYPAITLCNQNTFKLTAAVKGGWYDKVQQVLQNGAATATGLTCAVGQFLCDSKCIDAEKKCDYFCDCKNCLDETGCIPASRMEITTSGSSPIFGNVYGLYSTKDDRPIYMKLSTSNIIYLLYDNTTEKWIFSNRLRDGTIYASTTSNTTEKFPQHLNVDWTLHSNMSNMNIQFAVSDPIQVVHSIDALATNPKPNITLQEMYEDGGHKIVDVQNLKKQGCTWKKNDCKELDFKKQFTDLGLCYTFKRDNLVVENSGPGYGLKLTINIEAYEYTKDKSDGIGIKALLHDPLEIPLMGEKGFAVSPGLYSFVNIERTELENMKPPWGNCSAPLLEYYSHYSVSSCKMNCENKEVRDKCSCRDVHMPEDGKNNDLCTVDQWLNCASPLLTELRKAGNFCTCATPCLEKRYIPTLTFASISVDTESADTAQQEQNKEYAKRLSEAREIRFRINEEKYLETIRMFISMTTGYTEMYLFFRSAEEQLSGETKRINEITSLLRLDCQMINTKQHAVVKMLQGNVLHAINTYQSQIQTQLYFPLQQLQWVWKQSMDAVANATTQDEEEAIFRRVNESIWAQMSTLPAIMEILSNDLYNATKESIQNMTQDMEYRLLTERLVSIDEQASSSCEGCFTDSRNQPLTQILLENMMAYIKTTVYSEIYAIKENFERIYFDYTNGSFIPVPEIELVCFCPNYTNETDYTTTTEATTTETTTEITTTALPVWDTRINFNWTELMADIDSLVSNASSLASGMEQNLTEPIITAADYVSELLRLIAPKCSGELEKLYNEYTDTQTRVLNVILELQEDMLQRNTTYTSHMNDYEQVQTNLTQLAEISDLNVFMQQTKDTMITTESLLYNLRFTQVRLEKHIGNTEYWFMAQYDDDYLKGNSSYWLYFKLATPRLVDESSSYTDVKTKPMMTDTVIEEWWRKSTQTIDEVIGDLSKRSTSLLAVLNQADVYLDNFALGNLIDESFFKRNFLQLDVYYKELSEKKISQQKAYDYPALLSEVGGLMGLMLGASVMTVCELIDLLFYNGCMKCISRKKVGSKNDKVEKINHNDSKDPGNGKV